MLSSFIIFYMEEIMKNIAENNRLIFVLDNGFEIEEFNNEEF